MFIKLALKSLLHRKGSVLLTLFSMAISIFVLLAVEHIRHQAKDSFSNTVSGIDLIVGSRTGSLNLLLYSVFHVGSPTNNISQKSYAAIANNPQVSWAIPISLGDSHQGYRVVGTTPAFFEHYRYHRDVALRFEKGQPFEKVFDVVLGHEVAEKLGYHLQDPIVIAHGLAKNSFQMHADKPFSLVGVLQATGTPVDQSVYVSLQGIDMIHKPGPQQNRLLSESPDVPSAVTAVLLGLTSRLSIFQIQRQVNHYQQEPLTAILPGLALMELWQMMASLENILRLISAFVLIASLLGLSAMLLTSLRERSHEIQLLRMMGASPSYLFFLIQLEAMLICLSSMLIALLSLWLVVFFAQDFLSTEYGLFINSHILSSNSLYMLAAILSLSTLSSMIPALGGYLKAKA